MPNEKTDAKKKVHIDEGCNADDVELSHGTKDEITWCSKGSGFTVTFDGKSPFEESTFTVPAGQCCDSGPIVVDPPTGANKDKYKYSISNDMGKVVDPAVIIKK